MTEILSNVIQAREFAKYFDGFFIGSNDLTQLTPGIDRDSELLASLFSANDPAVQEMIRMANRSAQRTHTKIGLCGQAPSDAPRFARFLVEQGINSISFNPDALLKGIENIVAAEKEAPGNAGVEAKVAANMYSPTACIENPAGVQLPKTGLTFLLPPDPEGVKYQ